MKRFLDKKLIIGIIIGVLFSTTIGVAAIITSNEVVYTPKDTTWNVDNVKSALDDLYDTSLLGKTNIIDSLNNKGLNLDNTSTYNDIVNGINSLENNYKFKMMWSIVGYLTGATGTYSYITIDSRENDNIIPVAVTYYSLKTNNTVNENNEFWSISGTPHNIIINTKVDCIWKANNSDPAVILSAGSSITIKNAYSNNMGCFLMAI